MSRGIVIVFFMGAVTAPAVGQHPIVYEVTDGIQLYENFGASLAVLNDLDGDGVPEFVTSAAQDFQLPDATGYIDLISGKTGKILRKWKGTVKGEMLGDLLIPLGDLDHDGNMDFAAAANWNVVSIFSPVKDDPLLRIDTGIRQFSYPGEIAAADLDGDGVPELIIGQSDYDLYLEGQQPIFAAGRVSAYSLINSQPLWHAFGTFEKATLGGSIAVLKDLDGDGLPDLAVGEPMGNFGFESVDPGQVRILRGIDGTTLRTFDNKVGGHFGYQVINAGDLDGDGFPELLISAPGYSKDHGADQGWVGVYSTRNFELIRSFVGHEGVLSLGFFGDALGFRLGMAGDVDLDGVPDFLIGAYRRGEGIGLDYGRLDLRSGRTGALLASYEDRIFTNSWIGKITPLADIDGDGRPEFLVGSPAYGQRGIDQEWGRVLALRYEPDEPQFIRGDANGDGRINLADAIAVLQKVYFNEDSGDCIRALDVNGDEEISHFDFVWVVSFTFFAGYAPMPPFPECGRFGGLRQSRIDCRSSPCMTDRKPARNDHPLSLQSSAVSMHQYLKSSGPPQPGNGDAGGSPSLNR
jgi:FG-GAP repeat protein/dockerin type I repeat protein